MIKKAQDLRHGELVKFFDQWYEVMDIRMRGIAVDIVTCAGGRISFMYDSTVYYRKGEHLRGQATNLRAGKV